MMIKLGIEAQSAFKRSTFRVGCRSICLINKFEAKTGTFGLGVRVLSFVLV